MVKVQWCASIWCIHLTKITVNTHFRWFEPRREHCKTVQPRVSAQPGGVAEGQAAMRHEGEQLSGNDSGLKCSVQPQSSELNQPRASHGIIKYLKSISVSHSSPHSSPILHSTTLLCLHSGLKPLVPGSSSFLLSETRLTLPNSKNGANTTASLSSGASRTAESAETSSRTMRRLSSTDAHIPTTKAWLWSERTQRTRHPANLSILESCEYALGHFLL